MGGSREGEQVPAEGGTLSRAPWPRAPRDSRSNSSSGGAWGADKEVREQQRLVSDSGSTAADGHPRNAGGRGRTAAAKVPRWKYTRGPSRRV